MRREQITILRRYSKLARALGCAEIWRERRESSDGLYPRGQPSAYQMLCARFSADNQAGINFRYVGGAKVLMRSIVDSQAAYARRATFQHWSCGDPWALR